MSTFNGTPTQAEANQIQLNQAIANAPAQGPYDRLMGGGSNSVQIGTDDIKSPTDPTRVINIADRFEVTAESAKRAGLVKETEDGFVSAMDDAEVSPDGEPNPLEQGIDPTAPHVDDPEVQQEFNVATRMLGMVEQSKGVDATVIVDSMVEALRSKFVEGHQFPEDLLQGLDQFRSAVGDDAMLQRSVDAVERWAFDMAASIGAKEQISVEKMQQLAPAIMQHAKFPEAFKALLQGGQTGVGPLRSIIIRQVNK